MVKYQCVHQDSGLCETCFKYEAKIASLTARMKELEEELKQEMNACIHFTNRKNHYKLRTRELEAGLAEKEEWITKEKSGALYVELIGKVATLTSEVGRFRKALEDIASHDWAKNLPEWGAEFVEVAKDALSSPPAEAGAGA